MDLKVSFLKLFMDIEKQQKQQYLLWLPISTAINQL